MTEQPARDRIVLARVERIDITGDVILHLIRDETTVQLSDGAEYLTVGLVVDPWSPPE